MTNDHLAEPSRADVPASSSDAEEDGFVPVARASAEHGGLLEPPPDPEEAAVLAEEAEYEQRVLAGAAAAGRRAAAWMRGLPLPPGDWVRGPLAEAVEEVMTTLDPTGADRDVRGCGQDHAREVLDGLLRYLADAAPILSPRERTGLLAVVSCVRGVPRLLADDPHGVLHRGRLAAVCSLIDSAIARPPSAGPVPGRRTGGRTRPS
ncbi:hypothetical protein [Streptomyces showdoensis]|uniref:Uncharacterized protein n=1 Tax=Streptomyces showdoensis TaxID=68268 RepID=A0A2P2GFY2_STREW|nr:hypothetical protein [Streptomyces showdoensis]KKZ70420.1 hypothetical protein VO63_28965 [Streptomyces showdoensis]